MDVIVTIVVLLGAYLVFTMNKHFPLTNIIGFLMIVVAMIIELVRERGDG